MSSSKKQGWYIYQREAFTIANPEQVRAVCGTCKGYNTVVLRHKDTDEKAFGCKTCGSVTKEKDATYVLVPLNSSKEDADA